MKQKIFILNKILITSFLLFSISCNAQKLLTKKDLLLESTIENLNKFGGFLWSKEKDSIIINMDNLDIIKSKTKISKKDYLRSLYTYTTFIADSSRKVNDKNNYYGLYDLKENYRREFENYKPIIKMDSPKPNIIIKGSD